MSTEDVSDLRDVVDAINKLCETMKTSYDYDEPIDQETEETPAEVEANPAEIEIQKDYGEIWSEPSLAVDIAAEMYYSAIAEASLDMWNDSINDVNQREPVGACDEFYTALSNIEAKTERLEQLPIDKVIESGPIKDYAEITIPIEDPAKTESVPPHDPDKVETVPLNDPVKIETVPTMDPADINRSLSKDASSEQAETYSITSEERKTEKYETEAAAYETASEMYYTASSEVSLLSDTDFMEKVNDESDKEKSDKNIMAGHVAAMRERFESMTRANTPCPDLVRSLSPSLDMFRNITPSPDFLDKS